MNYSLRNARADDLEPVLQLLTDAGLPHDGVSEALENFLVAESGGRLVGAAGLEMYDRHALLRSVVVHPEWQGKGCGVELVENVIAKAAAASVHDVVLLTTTAGVFFARLGFVPITRADVPGGVSASVEFREACPQSAVVMIRKV